MSNLAILLGFALMIFLPCAIALLGSKEDENESAYFDRITDPVARTRTAQTLPTPTEAVTKQKASKPMDRAAGTLSLREVSDPIFSNPSRAMKQDRISPQGIEALMAQAADARSQADAHARNARLATAKAEAADVSARAAEAAAFAALQQLRRVA